MKKMGLVIIVIIAALALMLGSTYNGMVTEAENVNAAKSNVETMMQRRADLIPNLVATVKGYVNHEHAVCTEIAEARSKLSGAIDSGDLQAMDEANKEVSSALSRLLAITENYPKLEASQQFITLMDQIEGSENRITVARTDYNSVAQKYNTSIKKFPKNIFANMFGFDAAEYFEAEEGAEKAPQVSFD